MGLLIGGRMGSKWFDMLLATLYGPYNIKYMALTSIKVNYYLVYDAKYKVNTTNHKGS